MKETFTGIFDDRGNFFASARDRVSGPAILTMHTYDGETCNKKAWVTIVTGDDPLEKIADEILGPKTKEWGDPLSGDDFRPTGYKFAAKNRFLCRVEGDSCSPSLMPGDLTVWEIDGGPPFGVIVLAQREEDHCCTVKQYIEGDTPAEPLLRPVNKKYPAPKTESGWRVIARLVGVIREDKPERTWFWNPGLTPEMLK